MVDYHIDNNLPATNESIMATEAGLGMILPDCLKALLQNRDGFQVYKQVGTYQKRWFKERRILMTSLEHQVVGEIGYADSEFDETIVDATERFRGYLMMFAKEEDHDNGVEHDPHMMDKLICIGKRNEQLDDERFMYWMRAEANATDVYCIEEPIAGAYPLGYNYPASTREQLEKPLFSFDKFVDMMDIDES